MSLSPEDVARIKRLHAKAKEREREVWARRRAESQELLDRSTARHRAELNLKVDAYFRSKYGRGWRKKVEALRHAE